MQDIIHFILDHRDYAIVSHARPDGDSLGSSLALAAALKQLDKAVEVVNADPLPSVYNDLPGAGSMRRANRLDRVYDAVIVLETSDLERTGLRRLQNQFIINIDHHRGTLPYGNLNWVDDTAAAVAEMVYELIKQLGAKVTPEIATNIYVGILTDTGSFQFSNTRAKTFAIAHDLVQAGAHPAEIAEMVYLSHPKSKLRLLARVLDTLQLHRSNRIAWVVLTQEMLKEAGAMAGDTEGMVNYPLSIRGVEVVAFFREEREGRYRISLRSKDNIDVAAAAEYFGGGGHTNAAGLWAEGSFEEVRDRVVGQIEQLLV
jgi:bifunctional oligoribonuclease and PAP phosphatase NrnA